MQAAAFAAGICRKTAYNWRNSDPKFAASWDLALEDIIDKVESTVFDKALMPGKDQLSAAQFILRGWRPEKYAIKQINHNINEDAEERIAGKDRDEAATVIIERLERLVKK